MHYNMSDPLSDTTPTRQRITASVPTNHDLNLTLPPRPMSVVGEQAFAVLRITGTCDDVTRIMMNDTNYGVTHCARCWYNDASNKTASNHEAGWYVSIRGNVDSINRIVRFKPFQLNVVHASPNVKGISHV